MNSRIDTEKLTAYALGELPETERQQIAQQLQTDADARREVEAIQSLAGKLEQALANETAPALSSRQRREIASQAQPGRRIRFPSRWLAATAAAACLALALFSGLLAPRIGKHDASSGARIMNKPAQIEVALMDSEESDASLLTSGQREEIMVDTSPLDAAPAAPQPSEASVQYAALDSRKDMQPPLVMKGLYSGRSAEDRCLSAAPPAKKAYAEQPNAAAPGVYGPSLEHYSAIVENGFRQVKDEPLSTFSIDVDTASYANLRRYLQGGQLPPMDAVRIEEMINYFSYNYQPPAGDVPFSTQLEAAGCPWNAAHRLVRIGIKGRVIERSNRPGCNLVFLLDVSGSMQDENKLPLVQRAMEMLARQLDGRDRVAIVVYAGASGLVLPSTACSHPEVIIEAIKRLRAGGSTNGGEGIDLAYKTALEGFISNGVNRVILCTDGDFNVGVVQTGDLVRFVETQAKKGVFLSVLGFGMGNLKDSTLEQLADKGNGNYAYIDTFSEARKVLCDQLLGTLIAIAKDVKIQVEFNPARVAAYRLIGYENRMLNKEDFNDDKKDAGEIGAGHTVTALYEITPPGADEPAPPAVDALKYQSAPAKSAIESAHRTDEMLTVKIRYKQPDADVSAKLEFPLVDRGAAYSEASEDFRFASAVAAFGMLLRDSAHKGNLTGAAVLELAGTAIGPDASGQRREFLELVRNAQAMQK